mgnify:CR=1 FL=1
MQKYGGTSVGSLSRIESVADNIIATVRKGHQVVVVLSAMAGETNRLVSLAQQLDSQPSTRELDMLMATGEQVSISLLAIALVKRGISAVSLLAHQIGIATNNQFGNARIENIDTKRLNQALEQEQVVIVAGFQGQDRDRNVTTLGRGGSDTSAIALAVALKASECQIFTDVDGVYSADPRVVESAQRINALSFEEMLIMASLGAKVLHNRAVEYARAHEMPIRVLSSFKPDNGTMVKNINEMLAENNVSPVTNLAHHQQDALICIEGVADDTVVAQILSVLGENDIEAELLNVSDSTQLVKQSQASHGQVNTSKTLRFVINRHKISHLKTCLSSITKGNSIGTLLINDSVAKLSAIGNGMKSHAGIVGQFMTMLASEEIDILLISTSELSISVVIDESLLFNALRTLHSGFGLDASL